MTAAAAAAAARAGGFRDAAAEARGNTGACRAGLTAACAAAAAQPEVAAVHPAWRRQSRRRLRSRRRRAPADLAISLRHPVDLPWRLRARRRRWPVREQPPEQNQRIQGLLPLGCGAKVAARGKAGAGRAGLAAASDVAVAAAGAAAGPGPAPALRRACQARGLGRAWAGASGRPAPLS